MRLHVGIVLFRAIVADFAALVARREGTRRGDSDIGLDGRRSFLRCHVCGDGLDAILEEGG
jgi:hypothetical protein